MPVVRRTLGVLAAVAFALGLVAVASPAQAQSRSTWCSDWSAAGAVATVGRLAERTCVQVLHPDTGKAQVRAVAEVAITPTTARLRRRAAATPSASPSVSVSPTAPVVSDGIVIRNIHQTPGSGLTTTIRRYPESVYSNLPGGDAFVISYFSDYVELEKGTARVRTWASVTDGGVTKSLPLAPAGGYFTKTFAS